MRSIDGFELLSVRLTPMTAPVQISAPAKLATKYVRRLAVSPSVDRAWFDIDPPPPNPAARKDPELDVRYWAHVGAELPSVYVWNREYVRAVACANNGNFMDLADVFVFAPITGKALPRFRFLPNTILASGLVTNRFGWRGPDIALNREQGVIRVAFVGGSTTANPHSHRFSYPEFVGGWLNRWAQVRRLPVRFEIINLGHEGSNSNDFAAEVPDDLLPLDPDLVVYYEGSNQFWPTDFVDWPNGVPRKPKLTFTPPTWLMERSAIWRRLDWLVNIKLLMRNGKERQRGFGIVRWPADLDEHDPSLDYPKLPVNLTVILRDLDTIRGALSARGGVVALSSFVWLAHQDMRLDPLRHAIIYRYLNESFWPFPYAHMRRMADFQNRVFGKYAAAHGLPFLDVAARYPQDPDLFDDAIHMNEEGVRLHAWIAFNELVPVIEQRLAQGALPRPPPPPIDSHPAFSHSRQNS